MTYQEGQGHCPTCRATWGPITAYTCDGPPSAPHPRVRTVHGPPPTAADCPCPPHTDQHAAETGAGLTAYETWRAAAPAETFDDAPRHLGRGQLATETTRVATLLRADLDDDAPLHVYGQPDLEADVRAALEALPGARGYLSRSVPPGRLYVTAEQLDDPRAREVTP